MTERGPESSVEAQGGFERRLPSIAVFASGRGSNFVALADAVERGDLPVRIAVVVSDVETAPVLQVARERAIASAFIDPAAAIGPGGRYSRKVYGDLLFAALERHGVEYIALAGFMRLLGGALLHRFEHRIVNIHPSLLPAFPGLDAQRQALEAGVKVSGCTVHLVDAGMDTGPILAQRAVPVLDDDTVQSLSDRILVEEHDVYWRTLKLVVTGAVRLEGRRATFEGGRRP